MSTIDLQTFATIQAMVVAQIELIKISTPILFILGNFGDISNVIILAQRTFRTNSCAIYFLAASCVRLLFINYVILSNGLAVGKSVSTFCSRPSLRYFSLSYRSDGHLVSVLQDPLLHCRHHNRFTTQFRCVSIH